MRVDRRIDDKSDVKDNATPDLSFPFFALQNIIIGSPDVMITAATQMPEIFQTKI